VQLLGWKGAASGEGVRRPTTQRTVEPLSRAGPQPTTRVGRRAAGGEEGDRRQAGSVLAVVFSRPFHRITAEAHGPVEEQQGEAMRREGNLDSPDPMDTHDSGVLACA